MTRPGTWAAVAFHNTLVRLRVPTSVPAADRIARWGYGAGLRGTTVWPPHSSGATSTSVSFSTH